MSRAFPFTMPVSAYAHFSRRLLTSAAFRLRHYAGLAEERLMQMRLEQDGAERARSIRTWTTKAELDALYRLAAGLPPGAAIVEIGSYLGASTCFIGAGSAAGGARLTCVDTWQNETMPDGQRDTFAEFQRNLAAFLDRITIVRKSSADVLPADLPESIDFAFIDADHSYEATRTDAALVLPRMASTGIIAFHDTTTFAGVSRALGELVAGGCWAVAGNVESLTWLRRPEWIAWPLQTATEAPKPFAAP